MATIDSRAVICDIMAGKFASDGARCITEYRNAWGRITWGVTYPADRVEDKYTPSEFINNPEVIWTKKLGKLREPCAEENRDAT